MNPPSISRRSLTRGMAWAAPVIVIGASAPAFAASPPPPCNPQYSFVAGTNSNGEAAGVLTNLTGGTITVTFSSTSSAPPLTLGAEAGGNSIGWEPSNGQTSYLLGAGVSISATAVSGSSWSTTVTVPANASVSVSTFAGDCASTNPPARVTVTAAGCTYTYPVVCWW